MNLSDRIDRARGNVCSGCRQLILGNYDALRQHRVYVCDRSAEQGRPRWLANPNAFGKVLG